MCFCVRLSLLFINSIYVFDNLIIFTLQDKILKVFHVWAFCRDQSILNPNAAWRLIDLSSSPAEQWL